MKRFLRIATAALVATSFASTAKAGDATADAGGDIISAVGLANTSGLYFGSVVPGSTATGKATVSHDGTLQCDAVLTCLGDNISAARFVVSGEVGNTYEITLPETITLTSGSDTMTVIQIIASSATGSIAANGNDEFTVGGALQVSAGQAAGNYTGTFVVNVDYN